MKLNDYYYIKSNYVITGKAKTRDPSKSEPIYKNLLLDHQSINSKKLT